MGITTKFIGLEASQSSILDKKISTVKAIVLDSVNCNNKNNTITAEEEVFDIIRKNLKYKAKGTFYNYIISREGIVYNCVDFEKAAGKACVESIYSEKACTMFPETCPTTDSSVTPHTTRPDTELVSICTVSEPNPAGSVDSGVMSTVCETALKTLISYIVCKNNADHKTSLTSANVVLRSVFPESEARKKAVGHVYYKSNPTKFLMLKRNLDHLFISDKLTYKANLVKVDCTFAE